ncbi:S-layer homology domain-containing protein [Nostoc sp. UCD121]|uniref:S-layer homology domain-containing protein n=1 Tax=unclassified Nostoc TaxID=2593658 RepID=UPI001627F4E8|nr:MULTISPECIES: S-layer homology domain-containing protein [unclassified Nostoc]MBC1219484.1 S-layer homology domain-containing protein [Nostoc sp. UCD120]MBC1275339.1 S-layer homology domain-containing protein [Nostoc sp. UCD121]MBC1296213.1 S-layer homology domain-containing protein [Nostoc sp. UCD122]
MTNKPPSEPESSQRTALGFDEFIAILVAFSTVGAILFWSLSRRDSSWNFNGLLSSSTPSPSVQPNQVLPSLNPKVEPNVVPKTVLPYSPPEAVVEPKTPSLPTNSAPSRAVLPSAQVIPTQPPQLQTPVPSSAVLESSIKSSALPLVTPAKQKSIIPPPIAFNDVPTNFWGRRFIDVLSSRSILKGFPDYSFRPNQSVNRAEFAAIVQKAFDQEPSKTAIAFEDVPTKFWATPAIDQAINAGFLKGYPKKTFKPQQNISRVQVLVALVSGLNLKAPTSPNQILSVYKDAKDIPPYAISKIAAATTNGLVVNYPNPQILAPNKVASRAEVAAMIHQALVKRGKLEAISSPSIVRLPSTSPETSRTPKVKLSPGGSPQR